MRKVIVLLAVIASFSVSAIAWTAVQQTKVANPAPAPAPTVDEVLRSLRSDLQGNRADIVAKNVTLTSEQAAKFWPVFEKYQKEQSAIMDAQLKGIQQYVDGFDKLDDAGATSLIAAHLKNDAQMVALREKWLGEFQKVLPAKLAARVIQIDRRLSLAVQTEISARIPLIH